MPEPSGCQTQHSACLGVADQTISKGILPVFPAKPRASSVMFSFCAITPRRTAHLQISAILASGNSTFCRFEARIVRSRKVRLRQCGRISRKEKRGPPQSGGRKHCSMASGGVQKSSRSASTSYRFVGSENRWDWKCDKARRGRKNAYLIPHSNTHTCIHSEFREHPIAAGMVGANPPFPPPSRTAHENRVLILFHRVEKSASPSGKVQTAWI